FEAATSVGEARVVGALGRERGGFALRRVRGLTVVKVASVGGPVEAAPQARVVGVGRGVLRDEVLLRVRVGRDLEGGVAALPDLLADLVSPSEGVLVATSDREPGARSGAAARHPSRTTSVPFVVAASAEPDETRQRASTQPTLLHHVYRSVRQPHAGRAAPRGRRHSEDAGRLREPEPSTEWRRAPRSQPSRVAAPCGYPGERSRSPDSRIDLR